MYKIKHMLARGIERWQDDWRWTLSSSGVFTTASAYWLLESEWRLNKGIGGEASNLGESITFWKKVWKSSVPKRVQLLVWRAFHEGLPVLTELRRRGCSVDGVCVFCGYKNESVTHAFVDCWWAKVVWRVLNIEPPSSRADWEIADWLRSLSDTLSKDDFSKLLCGLFFIWEERNARFHGKAERGSEEIQSRVNALVFQMSRLPNYAGGYGVKGKADAQIVCDASWVNGDLVAGIAAVVRENGVVCAVNARAEEGIRSVSEAEGRALVLGMKMAEALNGHQHIIFLTDSTEVYRAASRGSSSSGFDSEWLLICLGYLQVFKNWEVELVSREFTAVADILAKRARVRQWSWLSHEAVPWWPEFSEAANEG